MASATDFLNHAAKKALQGLRKGWGGPFGAVVVYKEKILATACNTVLKHQDPTCHAEINALRQAARKRLSFSLEGCVVYSTTEPCPMCFSALHWARINRVVYSTVIKDVHKLGFNELTISNQKMKQWGKSPLQLTRIKNAACEELLQVWKSLEKKQVY
ncbi:MAG: Guanine deaminase [Elusimicrobia bacterium]|nr:Guanine deaminase [Elusimicrobiota bacterium]